MSDPRLGLTSASSAKADALCPARFKRQQGLPETPSDEAEAGTRMHEAYAADAPDWAKLSADEVKTVEMALDRDRAILAAWTTSVGADPETVERWITEKRLYGYAENWDWGSIANLWAVGGVVHSGQPDKAWRARDYEGCLHILVVDFKSGRIEVELDSHQLRDLAALVYENVMTVETVTVAINQPWAPGKPVLIQYGPVELAKAHSEMQQRVLASHDPEAKAVPGEDQCRYCRALAVCPEANSALVPVQAVSLEMPMKRGAAQALARSLTVDEQAAIWKKRTMAKKVFEAIEDELKKLDADALAAVGLCMEEGDDRRSITDTVELWNRLAKLGCSQQTFLGCVKVTIGKVRDAVQAVTGITVTKELNAKMAEVLEGICSVKQCTASLAERKEAKA